MCECIERLRGKLLLMYNLSRDPIAPGEITRQDLNVLRYDLVQEGLNLGRCLPPNVKSTFVELLFQVTLVSGYLTLPYNGYSSLAEARPAILSSLEILETLKDKLT